VGSGSALAGPVRRLIAFRSGPPSASVSIMIRLPSIRSKLLAIFLVASVLPITLVSLLAYRNSLRSVEEMVGNRTNRLAGSVREELTRKLSKRINDRLLTENDPLQRFLSLAASSRYAAEEGRAVLELQEYLQNLFEEYGDYYDELIVADAGGDALFRYHPAEGFATTVAVRHIPEPGELGLAAVDSIGVSLGRALKGSPGFEEPEAEARAQDVREMEEWRAIHRNLRDGMEALRALADSVARGELGAWVPPGLETAIREAFTERNRPPEAMPPPPGSARPPSPVVIPKRLRLQDLSDEDFVAAKIGKGMKAGDFALFTDRSGPGATLAIRLVRPIVANADTERRLGILVSTLRTDYVFSENLGVQRFGEEGELAVVNSKTGEVLFHTDGERLGQSLGRSDPRLLSAMMEELEEGTERASWSKVPGERGVRLATIFPVGVDRIPWAVIATAIPREFEKEARRAGFYNLLVASCALVVAGVVLLVASGRISSSIYTVTHGAREIAAGNLNHSIAVHTHDEIQTLGETFNAMTASLRESISLREKAAEELAALNRTLEDRVEVRTRELSDVNQALNRANQELKELDRMKTNFLHTVSHEFRTPLTSITAFSEILLDETAVQAAPPEVQRFLSIIHTESERLGRLIKNLLDLARIESGRIVWGREEFRIWDVVQSALNGLFPVFVEKEIIVTTDIRCPEARVLGDQDRIQQVITNLLENAVKFSGKGAGLWLSCREEDAGFESDRRLRVSVRDEGPGIPSGSLTRIFERFHQVDNSETRAAGGTGLGLAISKEIVEHHEGRIWAESEVGRGTTFHFTLPIQDGTNGRSNGASA